MNVILSLPSKTLTFFKEVRVEMQKVNWPSRDELMRLTLTVIAVSAFIALLLGLFDFVFGRVLFFANDFFSPETPQTLPVSEEPFPAQESEGAGDGTAVEVVPQEPEAQSE